MRTLHTRAGTSPIVQQDPGEPTELFQEGRERREVPQHVQVEQEVRHPDEIRAVTEHLVGEGHTVWGLDESSLGRA